MVRNEDLGRLRRLLSCGSVSFLLPAVGCPDTGDCPGSGGNH